MSTEEIVILSSVRTAVGSFGGSLKDNSKVLSAYFQP